MSYRIEGSFVFCGDYNLADTVTWQCGSASDDCGAVDVRGAVPSMLLDAMSLCVLKQVNSFPNSRPSNYEHSTGHGQRYEIL